MSEEISSYGVNKTRSVLGDVTNRVGKRGFSLISTSGVNSGDGYSGSVDKKNVGLQFAKKECLGMESLTKEILHKESMASVFSHRCSVINSSRGNVISGISKILCETKEPNSLDGVIHNGGGTAITDSVLKFGNAMRDSCVSKVSALRSSCNRDCLVVRGGIHMDEGVSVQGNYLHEKLETSVCMNDSNDFGLHDLDSGKDECIECSRLPESQESRTSGLERCIGLIGDRCSNSRVGIDLIKACSCSFCTKAAYVWSDLHYQDIKGRIAALKKSQKGAGILVQRSCRDNGIGRHNQGNFNKFSKLESDLTGQWRSLFLHMEDIFVRESSQLEASLFTLKDLIDNCKTELESINGMIPDKQ